MNETTGDALSTNALTEAARLRIASPVKGESLASVRVSPAGYFAASLANAFTSILLFRSEHDITALALFIIAAVVIPALALTDRISFDGKSLTRKGFTALLQKLSQGRTPHLSIEDVEHVETFAMRLIRRGGRVSYRYRSEVAGRGLRFRFASGGKNYRRMAALLFPHIAEEKLDVRTLELRDYLIEPRALRVSVDLMHVAPAYVLEEASDDLPRHARMKRREEQHAATPTDLIRARLLRRVANQLRAAGRLRESLDTFRRALLITPRSAGLLHEFARLLNSQAGAAADRHLLARSRAAMRLAARRAKDDPNLLSRIAESFGEYGDLTQASRFYTRALELDPRVFRAEIGLAEISLRDGKLAHVIHHYYSAARVAPDEALARLARREAEYFTRLNDDDDYLVKELRRIKWHNRIEYARRMIVRFIIASVLLALAGSFIEDALADTGWLLAITGLCAWMLARLAAKILSKRR